MFSAATHSLRERKKAKTRETIVRVALELFAEQGYSRTTIAQIAEGAEVSPRTVSTYFPAKEDIVFDISVGTKDRLAESVLERPKGQDTMSALREWLLNERKVLDDDHELYVCQRIVIDREDSLIAHEHALLREFESVLAAGIAADMGQAPADLEPRMAAAAAMAVFDLLRDEGDSTRVEGEMPPLEEQLVMLGQAFAFINGGVAALRPQRPA